MAEKNYEIIEEIAVLSENSKTDWRKEVNLLKWYDNDPKYDIRDWAPDRSRHGKGVTLTEEEWQELCNLAKNSMSLDGTDLEG